MKTLEVIGLNSQKVDNVVNGLSQLLADLHLYYSNLHGFHWHIKGRGFFQLHEQYEHFYNDAATKIDDVAERILQLGGCPESRYSEFLKVAKIAESGKVACGKEGMELLLDYLSVLIAQERLILSAANEAGDDVTAGMMSDYLAVQEKSVWMLLAFLDREGECGCGTK